MKKHLKKERIKNRNTKYLMDSEKFVSNYAEDLPLKGIKKAILCFSPSTAKKLKISHKGKRIYSLGSCWDIYEKTQSVVVSHFGVGASASLIQFEYLKAFKIPLIFSLGAIASFNKKLKLGQQLFIHQAYEEENSSLYYHLKNLSKKQWAANFRKKTKKQFIKNPYKKEAGKLIKDLSLQPVTSVSCNRPYKIQKEDYKFYISHKISGLEMEASSLISEGKQQKVPLFCLAVVSDFLDKNNWEMGFSKKKFKNSLFDLLEKLLFYKFH